MSAATLPAVVDLHFTAFAGYMNTRLSKRYVVNFLNWFKRDPEGIALVAFDGGRPAGYAVGAPIGYQPRLTKATLAAPIAGVFRRPWLLLEGRFRRIAWGRIQGTIWGWKGKAETGAADSRAFSLVGIGVAPEAHGRHVGWALMKSFEAEARARGARRLRLSLYASNAPARSLYERAGWALVSDPGQETLYYEKTLQ